MIEIKYAALPCHCVNPEELQIIQHNLKNPHIILGSRILTEPKYLRIFFANSLYGLLLMTASKII